jgi:flavin reductase (DIM6/NTAB) family NADH-FMN oxidoreductase RutF
MLASRGSPQGAKALSWSLPSMHVRAPRVAEAPINIECTVHAVLPMGDYDHLLIGRVHVVHIRADLYEPYGHIDHLAMAPIGRLAGTYSTVDNLFTTPAN